MKKIAKYFFIAAASFAAMSCVEELNVVEKPVELTGKAYVFTADFDAETKTVLDEETMTPMWYGDAQGNEYITVMEPGSVNTYVAEGLTEPVAEATFVMAENGGTGLTGTAAFAVSPAGAWTCFNNSTDGVGVTVNYLTTQTAYADTYDPAAPVAVAYNEDIEANPNFSFKNASALLKFQITADSEPVKSVKFYSLGGETLAGEITLMNDADGKPAIVPGKGASSWVEIVAAEGKTLEAETNYYISVAPAVLAKGIGFQFNDMEGIETFTIPTEIKIERNKIYDLGIFRYEASKDDKWYLVGNGTTDFTTVMFQADGDNLVAKNVPFSGEQSFKVLNPAKGVAYYVNAEEVKTETWIDLTEEKGTVCPAKGTYDVYVDYVEETITGVALTTPGTYAPEYLTIEGMQFSYMNYDYGSPVTQVIAFYPDAYIIASSYDDAMYGAPEEYIDPSMAGKWEEKGVYENVTYEPVHATGGFVKAFAKSIDWWGNEVAKYYLIKYSNLTESTGDFYSPTDYYDENGLYVLVYDEDGNPVGTEGEYWDEEANDYAYGLIQENYWGIGLCGQIENYWEEDIPYEQSFIPETLNVYNQTIDVVYPVPSGQFIGTFVDYETGNTSLVMIDLGVLGSDVITVADNFAYMSNGMSDDELAYYHYWGAEGMWGEGVQEYEWMDPEPEVPGNWVLKARYSGYDITPTGPDSGVITFKHNGKDYMIEYTGYMYNNSIGLKSPEVFFDEDGKPTSYVGLGYDELNMMAPDPIFYPYTSLDVVEIAPIEEVKSDAKTPDGRQWFFVWEDMMGAPSCLDFGVTTPGQVGFCYDAAAIYGEENLPEYMLGKYMWYMGWEYSIEAEDETSGVVNVTSYDHFGDKVVTPIAEYYDYNGLSMVVYSEMWYLNNVTVFAGKPQSIYVENGGIMQ